MSFHSPLLGDFEVDPDRVLEFPNGLLGFEEARRFVMVEHENTGLYWWLQAIDQPDLTFLAVVPWAFFPDYEPEIGEDHQHLLKLDDPADAIVLCLVTIRGGDGESASLTENPAMAGITTNLLGPIVINQRNRVGGQVVLNGDQWSVQAALVGN